MKKNFFEELNLRPNERRIVIVVGVIVFVVLNAWFVWPHFSDASHALATIDKGRADWTNHYQKIELDTKPGGTKDKIRELMKVEGATGLEGSQAIQLTRKVQEKAPQYGVTVLSYNDIQNTAFTGKTNQFFEEHALRISVQCGESNLVNFLYDMANDPAMIRVRELHLKPADMNRYRLTGDVLLAANYQKKPPEPARATTTPARSAATSVPKPTMNSTGQKKPPAKL
jgi:hypothetical protein